MTVENYNTGAENMATHETYLVEYHVLFSGDSGQRFNGSFQFEGAVPSKEQVLGNIVRENPDTDWSDTTRGSYTVSRLMNNNVHIVEEQGAFTPDELNSAHSA
jgi:hypothetical protein